MPRGNLGGYLLLSQSSGDLFTVRTCESIQIRARPSKIRGAEGKVARAGRGGEVWRVVAGFSVMICMHRWQNSSDLLHSYLVESV
jgi:hypothetical protein